MTNAGNSMMTAGKNFDRNRVEDIRRQTSAHRDAEARKNMEALKEQKAQRALENQILIESPQQQKVHTQIKVDRWVAAELARS